MPLPNFPQNAIVGVFIESRCMNQRLLFQHWYQATTVTGPVAVDVALSDICEALGAGGAASLVDNYVDCLPTNQTVVGIYAQMIYPVRYQKVKLVQNAPGTVASPATQANTAATITLYDGFGGRSHISTKHIGAMPANAASNGLVTGGHKDSLNDFALPLVSTRPIPGVGTLTPGIYHRNGDGAAQKFTQVYTWSIGDTVRTMRRRTVGLGE